MVAPLQLGSKQSTRDPYKAGFNKDPRGKGFGAGPGSGPAPVYWEGSAFEERVTGQMGEEGYRTSPSGGRYHFGDVSGVNHARQGRACQSSTRYGGVAALAIDGNRDPYFYGRRWATEVDPAVGGSVTHTFAGPRNPSNLQGGDPEPWWQVTLAQPTPIGTIAIYGRLADIEVPEVQRIQVHANSPLGVDGVAHDEEWGWADANGTRHNQHRANESATRRGTGNSPTGGGYFTLTMPSIANPTDRDDDGATHLTNHTTAPIRIDAVVSRVSLVARRVPCVRTSCVVRRAPCVVRQPQRAQPQFLL